jgi:hypothetical protein
MEFAQLCHQSDITFIGPPASAIRDMGIKRWNLIELNTQVRACGNEVVIALVFFYPLCITFQASFTLNKTIKITYCCGIIKSVMSCFNSWYNEHVGLEQWFSNFFGSWCTVKYMKIFWHTSYTKLKIY